MEKKEIKYLRKNISLPEELLIEVQLRKNNEGFNLSAWITNTYYKEFASTEHLNKIKLKNIEENKIIDEIIKAKQTNINV